MGSHWGSHIEVLLGSYWGHIRVTLWGPIEVLLGVTVGSHWGPIGVPLGSHRDHTLGSYWGHIGVTSAHTLGSHWGSHIGVLLGSHRGPIGGHFGVPLGSPRAVPPSPHLLPLPLLPGGYEGTHFSSHLLPGGHRGYQRPGHRCHPHLPLFLPHRRRSDPWPQCGRTGPAFPAEPHGHHDHRGYQDGRRG